MATEKRLIDANDFNKSPAFLCGGFPGDPYYDGYCDALERIQEVLEQFPTVDAVEVVRCAKCRYYETAEYYPDGTKQVCRLLKRQMQEDNFCSCGERRNDG